MVLINDKKFACATCIKGHRVSGCTHTDRPLFEVKKKGRPTTQCVHCKDKRKKDGASVHTKCLCGDVKPPTVIMPTSSDPSIGAGPSSSSAGPSSDASHTTQKDAPTSPNEDELREMETRKGQPGSRPTFPNGFRDVHEMSAAAEALADMNEVTAVKQAERSVHMLLNPCQCRTGGICKCCHPKRPAVTTHRSDGSASPSNAASSVSGSPSFNPSNPFGHPSGPSRPSLSGSSTPTFHPTHSPTGSRSGGQGTGGDTLLSPENMHHPAHTSRHVHKTKLYSPYSTSGHATPRHAKRDSVTGSTHVWGGSQPSGSRSSPPAVRPLVNLKSLLGAVIRDDGTIANEIPRSALGLPGISAFDAVAQNGGVKLESMDMDVDPPVHFPTSEDVVVGGCTCEDDCDCPGCPTHNIPSRGDHAHSGSCGQKCTSSFECCDRINIPPGITSIKHLLEVAAAHVPPPARPKSMDLNAHDTDVSPPAVHVSEDAARGLGFVQLKPLECCNGRCQCKPGTCSCEKDCCGCCIRCACAEDAADDRTERGSSRGGGESVSAARGRDTKEPSCCSGETAEGRNSPSGMLTPPIEVNRSADASSASKQGSSCCSGKAHPPTVAPINTQAVPASNLLSPESASAASSAQRSHHASRSSTPVTQPGGVTPPVLRRAASISQSTSHLNSSAASARRATVTASSLQGAGGVHRSASTGKSASKALALHQQPNHPRAILPKPQHSASHLGVPKQGGSGSGRNPSPTGRRTSSSGGVSRSSSPGAGPSAPPVTQGVPQGLHQHRPSIQITPTEASQPTISFPVTPGFQLPQSSDGGQPQQMDLGALASDPDFLAYLEQIAPADASSMYPVRPPAPTSETGLSGQSPGTFSAQRQSISQPAYDADATMAAIDLDLTIGMSFDDIIAQMMADGQGQAPQVEFSHQQQSSNPPSRDPFDFSAMGAQGRQDGYLGAGAAPAPPGDSEQVNDMLSMMASGQGMDQFWAWQQQQQQQAQQHGIASQDGQQGLQQFQHLAQQQQQQQQQQEQQQQQQSMLPHQSSPRQHGGSSSVSHGLGQGDGSRSASASLPPSRPSGLVNEARPAGTAVNPDIIDLSKPLDAQDVERILRALQRQQASQDPTQQATPVQQQSQQQAQAYPQPSGSTNRPPGLQVPPPPPLQPGYADSVGSAFTSSADGSDPFDAFVLDNPGEGLDLSALDLGGHHSRNASAGTGVGSDHMGFMQQLGQVAGVGPSFDGGVNGFEPMSGPSQSPSSSSAKGQDPVDWERVFSGLVGSGTESA